MLDFDFDFDSTAHEYRAYYKGFTIRAVNDTDAENPWESWDCEPPILVKYDRHISQYSEKYGDISNPFAFYSDGQINRHWKKIVSLVEGVTSLGFSFDLNILVNEKLEEWGFNPNRPPKGEKLDARREVLENETELDDFDLIAELFQIIGIPALSTVSTGYSQSDYAELLIVLTPDLVKEWGTKLSYLKKNAESMLQNSADLYSAWAWGDVYGFIISDKNDDNIESCFGFYGADFNKSGLIEHVTDSLKYIIKSRKEKRFARLKELIRSNVPLHIRADIMGGVV